MSNIKVTCKLNSYDNPVKPSVNVHSHWNDDDLIVIEYMEEKITLVGKDLKAAIDNCMNTARF